MAKKQQVRSLKHRPKRGVVRDGARVWLFTRNGYDWTGRYRDTHRGRRMLKRDE